jgi:hypothetical protein
MYLERYLASSPYLHFIFYDQKKNLLMEINDENHLFEIINHEFNLLELPRQVKFEILHLVIIQDLKEICNNMEKHALKLTKKQIHSLQNNIISSK